MHYTQKFNKNLLIKQYTLSLVLHYSDPQKTLKSFPPRITHILQLIDLNQNSYAPFIHKLSR